MFTIMFLERKWGENKELSVNSGIEPFIAILCSTKCGIMELRVCRKISGEITLFIV